MGLGRVGDRVPGSFLLVWEVSFSLSLFHSHPSLPLFLCFWEEVERGRKWLKGEGQGKGEARG